MGVRTNMLVFVRPYEIKIEDGPEIRDQDTRRYIT